MAYFIDSSNQVFYYEDEVDSSFIEDKTEITEVEAFNLIANQSPGLNPTQVRDRELAALVHDFGDGRVVQCRPHPYSDESNMRNEIERMTRTSETMTTWFSIDNTPVTLSISDLRACIEAGQDQAKVVWESFFNNVTP